MRNRRPQTIEAYLAARTTSPLRELRLARGATIFDLAGAAGVSPAYISQIERHPTVAGQKIYEKLAIALGTTPERLIPQPGPRSKAKGAR